METLATLFKNVFFRIPDYQRGYAWKCDKQLPELWDDIDEILEKTPGKYRPHYTGTIFVEEMKAEDVPETERWMYEGGATFYSVVDGQQRLTTISILLFELLKAENVEYNEIKIEKLREQYVVETNASGKSKVYHFSYIGDQNDHLLSCVFEDKQVVVKDKKQTAYTHNLMEAKKFFAQKIACLSKQERDILFKKVTTALSFDLHKIDDDLDVQAVFETMNNRGKPLTVLEKLKNRLIYLTEKLQAEDSDKKTLRKNINNAWGRVYTDLAMNPDNVLDEDDFLSAHLSLYRNPPEYVFSEKQTETKIFQMFCNKADRFDESLVDFNKINDYVRDLSDFVSYWVKVNNPDNIWLQKIYLLETRKEIKIFICALMKALHGTSLDRDLQILESIIFRANTPYAWGGRDIRTFATLARDLYAAPNKLQEIRESLERELHTPVNTAGVVDAFSGLFTYVRGNIGYHRWGALKYLLFEYEEYLHGKEFSQDEQKVFIGNYHSTAIEHIMPRDLTYWDDEISDFLTSFSEEQTPLATRIILNTLGNLTILKDPKNSSVSNHPWVTTPEIEGKRDRYASGSFSEILISQNNSWNKQSILARGKEILNFLLKEKLGVAEDLSEDQLEKALFYSSEYYRLGFGVHEETSSLQPTPIGGADYNAE